MKDEIIPWLEDEESRFIFSNRVAFNESSDFIYMREIIDRYVPELEDTYYPGKEKELIDKISDKKNVWIWGAGAHCTKLLREVFSKINIKAEGIIDRNPVKPSVLGIPVFSPDQVDFQKIDCLIISMAKKDAIQSSIDFALSSGMNQDNIIVYQDYFKNCDLPDKQYFEPFIEYNEGETFIDVGALDLGTSLRFVRECEKNHISDYKIYAFEPDKESHQKCTEIARKHPELNITLYNCGLWSSNTTLSFDSRGDCASKIVMDDNDSNKIDVVSLDSLINDKVTYLKMDIEGAEPEALKGCQNIIRQYKPKLAISVYHNKADIIEIPKYIKSLVPEYRLYLRHYSSHVSETVLYALP